MDIIAIGQLKGGVGKTATTHALGTALSERGYKVLMIDSDPQASLTGACGLAGEKPTLSDVLGGTEEGDKTMQEIIKPLSDNLSLAPSDLTLAKTDRGLTQRLRPIDVLKPAIESLTGFDFVLIDCPPSLSQLTLNVLNSAHFVLIPSQPAAADLRGLEMYFETLQEIYKYNPELEVIGILPTFYDGRLNHHTAAVETLIGAGYPVLSSRIGRSVKVQEASARGKSVIEYDPKNKRSEEYQELTEELLSCLKKMKAAH